MYDQAIIRARKKLNLAKNKSLLLKKDDLISYIQILHKENKSIDFFRRVRPRQEKQQRLIESGQNPKSYEICTAQSYEAQKELKKELEVAEHTLLTYQQSIIKELQQNSEMKTKLQVYLDHIQQCQIALNEEHQTDPKKRRARMEGNRKQQRASIDQDQFLNQNGRQHIKGFDENDSSSPSDDSFFKEGEHALVELMEGFRELTQQQRQALYGTTNLERLNTPKKRVNTSKIEQPIGIQSHMSNLFPSFRQVLQAPSESSILAPPRIDEKFQEEQSPVVKKNLKEEEQQSVIMVDSNKSQLRSGRPNISEILKNFKAPQINKN